MSAIGSRGGWRIGKILNNATNDENEDNKDYKSHNVHLLIVVTADCCTTTLSSFVNERSNFWIQPTQILIKMQLS